MKVESLLAGDVTPVATFDFGAATPSNFVFSPDGQYLYGSSYYTGVSNIFRYDLASGKLDAVSNTETGLLPAPAPGRRTRSSSSATRARASWPPPSRPSRWRT